jgi:diketogulonate reductase-like aldo/keto reductase
MSSFQVECHPYLNQTKLIEFCKEKGIWITAYSPFAGPTSIAPLHKGESPEPLKDPKIKELAEKYRKTVAQVILRYLVSLRIFSGKETFKLEMCSAETFLNELKGFMNPFKNPKIFGTGG